MVGWDSFERQLSCDRSQVHALQVHFKNAADECSLLGINYERAAMRFRHVPVAQRHATTMGMSGFDATQQASSGPFEQLLALIFCEHTTHLEEQASLGTIVNGVGDTE